MGSPASSIAGGGGASGGGGGLGGSTGAADNRVLRSDGTGGATIQPSDLVLGDDESLSFGGEGSTNPKILPTVASAPSFALTNGTGALQAGLSFIRRAQSVQDGVEVGLPDGNDGFRLYRLIVADTRTVLLTDVPQVGWEALFVIAVTGAQMTIQAATGFTIVIAGVGSSTAGGTAVATDLGASLLLTYSNTNLFTGMAQGTWVLA